jgi:hypothetical protein
MRERGVSPVGAALPLLPPAHGAVLVASIASWVRRRADHGYAGRLVGSRASITGNTIVSE